MDSLVFNPWRDLVGRPYDKSPCPPLSFDCYSLVVWVRAHCYLRKTPLLIDPKLLTSKMIHDDDYVQRLVALHRDRAIYHRVDHPEPSDIMVFADNHIGVVVEDGVLSAVAEGSNSVVYFDWRKMNKFYSDAYAVRYSYDG